MEEPVVQNADSTEVQNPFDVVAMLLMEARLSLDEVREGSSYPRYVRILRSKSSEGGIEIVQNIVTGGVEGFTNTVSKLIDLTLDAKDLLDDVDALVALAEVGIDIIQTITKDEFLQSLALSFTAMAETNTGASARITAILDVGSGIQYFDKFLDGTKEYLKYVPAPEDLDRIGFELYRLARIYQKEGTQDQARKEDLAGKYTGRARLLQWGFDFKWDVYHKLSASEGKTLEIQHLGKLPFVESRPTANNFKVNYGSVKVYEFDGSTKKGDITDAANLLDALKYPNGVTTTSIQGKIAVNDVFKTALREFQYNNDLPITCDLDNDTVNRLFNIDCIRKNLKRAVPWTSKIDFPKKKMGGYLSLINGDADSYADEEIDPITSGEKSYYELGTGAWKRFPELAVKDTDTKRPDYPGLDEDEDTRNKKQNRKMVYGFVGMQSRFRVNQKEPYFQGGTYSEGEASEGEYFFAARHTEPWEAGRTGKPTGGLFKSNELPDWGPLKGSVSQMFQIVDIPDSILTTFEDCVADGAGKTPVKEYELVFFAHCMGRSLYKDHQNWLPDQGRIQLQIIQCDAAGKLIIKEGKFYETLGSFVDKPVWFPDRPLNIALLKNTSIERKTTWFLRQSQRWFLTKQNIDSNRILKARVILEGCLTSAWDIDAYFDDVRIRWQILPKTVAQ